MPDDLYETDIVGWSEDQAARLRRVAAGGAPPDAAGVDWANVVEEVESVGRSMLGTVRANLGTAWLRVLLAHGWPGHPDAGRWLEAADTALATARGFLDPGMERRLDPDRAYRDARRAVGELRMDGRAPRRLPAAVPFGFRDLLDPAACNAHGLLRRVGEAAAAGEGAAGFR